MSTNIATEALLAVQQDDFSGFGNSLQRDPSPESFGILTSQGLSKLVAKELGSSDIEDWITRPKTWSGESYGPAVTFTPAETLLHLLWQDLNRRLTRKLDKVFQTTLIASRGAILCFFGDPSLSLIVGYHKLAGGAVSFEPVAAIERPLGVFELPHLFQSASPKQRNAIKAVALSADKVIFQRGVIIHVDRQTEDVFGPSIDTIILGELLMEWACKQSQGDSLAALEVGSGSGLLATMLAGIDGISRVVAIDLNPAAVSCTLKNMLINEVRLDAIKPRISVRCEQFETCKLPAPFDLIVCNPPYIPNPPCYSVETRTGYAASVSGLELCVDLLAGLNALLSDSGQLLLMTSSVSAAEIEKLIPRNFKMQLALDAPGRRVPLDVDTVWANPKWHKDLVNRGLVETDDDGNLWHYLQPLWITRKGGGSSA